MNEHVHEEIQTNIPQPVAVSWGAIIAGLFAVLSTSWLLYLLGAAIGVSVTDVADDTMMNDGLPEAAIVWMLLSSLIAYFVGSALASRMANTVDEAVGMMHGFVVWSVATVVMVWLSYLGVSSLLQTGASVVQTTGSAATTAISATAQGVGSVGSAVGSTVASGAEGATGLFSSVADTEAFQRIASRLNRRAAEAIASVDPEGGAEVSAEDVRNAINDLDAETLDQVLADLADNDQDSAAGLIADQTNLSRAQADELISGAYTELEERLGDPDDDQSLAEDLQSQLASNVAGVIASADARGGAEVSREDIAEAMEQLDAEAMEEAAYYLIQGETNLATDLIVEETDLSRAEVRALVSGIQRTYRRQVNRLSQTMTGTFDSMAETADKTMDEVVETVDESVETASSYAQQVLWASFAAAGLGLAVSVLGGWCGADTHRRMYYDVRSRT
ncbi:hypothetical protein [Botrimarina mediterranea]|uniref:Uncharacterized protein n=1 Tax=Botrimarina mediterranea TaxID=2528022 RepID=A0A518KA80_9BACT|nr:hypothetical protein [Botrimarina mediterranea]QDV74705.1 hypothetical protein Spa11_29130 [Botrimarina mediterranea]